MFSATGQLLPGSTDRPDIFTFAFNKKNILTQDRSVSSQPCTLNILGYIPVVSTFSGIGRSLLGIVHSVVHLACAIFSQNRTHHLSEAKLGAKNIVRGLVEAIPVIGNITLLIVDVMRMKHYQKMAEECIKKNEAAYNDQAVLFVYGKEVAKKPIQAFYQEVKNLNRKLSAADAANIIRKKTASPEPTHPNSENAVKTSLETPQKTQEEQVQQTQKTQGSNSETTTNASYSGMPVDAPKVQDNVLEQVNENIKTTPPIENSENPLSDFHSAPQVVEARPQSSLSYGSEIGINSYKAQAADWYATSTKTQKKGKRANKSVMQNENTSLHNTFLTQARKLRLNRDNFNLLENLFDKSLKYSKPRQKFIDLVNAHVLQPNGWDEDTAARIKNKLSKFVPKNK